MQQQMEAASAAYKVEEVELNHAAAAGPEPAADAAAADSLEFGLLQLLLTGCVLLLLGGCHSSCETLIYTVLTDLVEAAGDACDSTEADVLSGCTGRTHCCSAGYDGSGSSSYEQCSAQVLHVPGKHCASRAGGVGGAAAADEARMDASVCCAQGSGGHGVSDGTTSSTGMSDNSEVVMVLYVLFWVVGFTVGAGVAGLPVSSVLGQQLTACAVGLVLACSAFWAWRTAAAAFGSTMLSYCQ